MIDELYKAADAIEKAGISTGEHWHGKLKKLPNGLCVRIWLKADGTVVDIEALPENLVAELRKYEPDLGKALPGFNVCPLYRIVKPESEIKGRRAVRALETALREDANFSWDVHLQGAEDFWNRTREVLKQIKVNVLPKMEAACDGNLLPDETLSKFLSAVDKLDIETFKQGYEEKVKAKVIGGSLPVSLICYFVDERRKQKEDADSKVQIPKVSVFLDVKDYTEYPVSHIATIKRLNDLLMESGSTSIENKDSSSPVPVIAHDLDAYGKSTVGMSEKFGSVKLPKIGIVGLRSQVKAIPAQARYGLCESETFPVGNETRKEIKAALSWLSDQAREGKTFGLAGDRELLFAYPAQLPEDSIPELASLLGAGDDEFLSQQKFESLSESVIAQLHGLGEASKEGELHIFSLRKADASSPKTKVVYYRNTSVDSLEAASRDWDAGFKNIPPLNIRTWSKEKNEAGNNFPVLVEPQTLFPIKLHKNLNTVWTLSRDKIKQNEVKLFEPSTGLRLLLDTPETAHAAYIMERFMSHAQTYFITLCRAKGRNEISNLENLDTYPGVLGLLLYKLGKTKEHYMNESAFQLGRFLRVADEIHRLYCEVVRNGDIPPELCGSSALTATLENPTQALAQLSQRSAPYLKWANAYRGGDMIKSGEKSIPAVSLVRSWLKKWSPIAEMLHEMNWPARPSPMERAQIFLGYLSAFPKSEKPETETTENEGPSNEQ